ncbi:MAG: nucleotidyl transferase AbiEii/AbiGii toxin family protein [Gemmatimonadaceae bacterium]|nr:nucleotidyl transferase AbiEii/AbiGii toxin family protein [Gemmatimonadaceae bacterium]
MVLCRALVAMFSQKVVADRVVFRGGTALHKLFFGAAGRYSEDIDLVQTTAEPIGPTMDALRRRLDGWLGTPRREFSDGRVTLLYRFESEGEPAVRLKLKVEINSREHFTVLGLRDHPFAVHSRWFSGEAAVVGYTLDEQLGTKLRALYQRRKGRDLFDLWDALTRGASNPDRVVAAFLHYMKVEGHRVSRAEFEENLSRKLADARFVGDVAPLLAPATSWRPDEAVALVRRELIARLPGDGWKGRGAP